MAGDDVTGVAGQLGGGDGAIGGDPGGVGLVLAGTGRRQPDQRAARRRGSRRRSSSLLVVRTASSSWGTSSVSRGAEVGEARGVGQVHASSTRPARSSMPALPTADVAGENRRASVGWPERVSRTSSRSLIAGSVAAVSGSGRASAGVRGQTRRGRRPGPAGPRCVRSAGCHARPGTPSSPSVSSRRPACAAGRARAARGRQRTRSPTVVSVTGGSSGRRPRSVTGSRRRSGSGAVFALRGSGVRGAAVRGCRNPARSRYSS